MREVPVVTSPMSISTHERAAWVRVCVYEEKQMRNGKEKKKKKKADRHTREA